MKSEVFNMDCMEGMKQYPDKYFDLAIVDPPYGVGDFQSNKNIDSRNGKHTKSSEQKYKRKIIWNNEIPTEEYFKQLKRIARNHIIFGFQHYTKFLWPELRGVIIHDFKDNTFQMSHADIAITNLQKRVTLFRYLWAGFKKEFKEPTDFNRIHPCEKPVSLYKWLLHNYAQAGFKILDTHLGSGSSRIAAYDLGIDFTGFEIDKHYFDAQEKRFNEHIKQLTMEFVAI